MKKLFLSVIGLFLTLVAAFSQDNPDSSGYKSRKLTFEEANIVTSYYHQDGSHAAVTGGIGSQKLTDLSTSFDIRMNVTDRRSRKHVFTGEIGIDHYTSASSDKIDPVAVSSASSADTRIYPSLGWSVENEKKGTSFGAGISYSNEFDYQSFGINTHFAKKTKDKSGELGLKAQGYFDQVSIIHPIELRTTTPGEEENGRSPRNSINGGISWTQIINRQFQLMVEGEMIYQEGYLGLPFHRVYFTDNSVHVEKLPSTRLKIPLGIRASYFAGDRFIIRGWFRNYHDDWGISSNAAQLETVVKITPFFSFTPFYRFYSQQAADYFAPYQVHTSSDDFYTSNYDLSKFNSQFFGAGLRIAPPGGIFHQRALNAMELRYGHYEKNVDMNANIISLHIKLK